MAPTSLKNAHLPHAASPTRLYDFTCKIRKSPAQQVPPTTPRLPPNCAFPHKSYSLTLRLAAARTFFLINLLINMPLIKSPNRSGSNPILSRYGTLRLPPQRLSPRSGSHMLRPSTVKQMMSDFILTRNKNSILVLYLFLINESSPYIYCFKSVIILSECE